MWAWVMQEWWIIDNKSREWLTWDLEERLSLGVEEEDAVGPRGRGQGASAEVLLWLVGYPGDHLIIVV